MSFTKYESRRTIFAVLCKCSFENFKNTLVMKKTKHLRHVLTLVAVAFLLPFLGKTQTETVLKIDALMSEAVAKDLFSGNVLITENGKTVYEKPFGKADIAKNVANTLETRFQIASLTKLPAKILVLQLIEEKKLSLDAPLSNFLEGFAENVGKNVTIAHLLNHQSGFGQYNERDDFMENRRNVHVISDLLPFIRQEKLLFEPGSRSEYSNSGYVVLAAIIEKITGKSYGENLKTRIFQRLDMNDSDFSVVKSAAPKLAVGYVTRQVGAKRSNENLDMVAGGDGGIFMTVKDFSKLDESIFTDNKLLSDDSKAQLFKLPLSNSTSSWADFQAKARFAIGGGAPGISTIYSKDASKRRSIIVFSNYDEGSSEEIARRLSAILNGDTPQSLRVPLGRFLYDMLTTKGAAYFSENATSDLEKAAYKLDDDMILLFVGQQLLEEKRADEAIALYQMYTTEFPRIVVAWNDFGDAFLLKNNKTEAKKCFERALKLRPANRRAKEMLQKLN